MATLEAIDVAAAAAPSNLNREQVLQNIVDISNFPTPFREMIGTTSHTNPFFEWSCDRLAAPDTTNVVIDGSAATTPDGDPAVRMGNHAQISQKTVGTSTRFETLSNVGNESLARQVQKKTYELQRDIEAMLLLNNSNVADTGTGGVAGETAGLEAWLDDDDVTDTPKSPATVIDASGELTLSTDIGGWTNRSGNIVKSITYTALTTPGAGSFADLKDILNALWQLGADPTKVMSIPKVIEKLSAFMFTSSAQIASLVRDRNEMGAAQAQAAVNTILTDHGLVVDLVANRLMQLSGDGSPDCATLFAFDPQYLSVSYAGGGIRSKELPVSGLSRSVQLHADYGLCVMNPETLGAIICLDEDLAWTA